MKSSKTKAMKKLNSTITAIIITATLWAQSPEKMSYQAIIRNSSNALVTNSTVGMKISILQGTAGGTAVYTETQTPTTNANGLVSIEIGGGTGFDVINWASGPYFIKTETDPSGGTNYTITGTSQLLSVPYALHAKRAENVTITGTEDAFSGWDKNTNNDVILLGDQTISGIKTFTDKIKPNGIDLPYSFGPDPDYIGDEGNYISFAHTGASEDFIGYKNNTFYFKDSPNGGDVTDPDVIVGGKIGIGIETPIEKLEVDGNIDLHIHSIKNLVDPVNEQDAATKAYVDDNAPATYSIGDSYQGGIIFWLDATGQHGLIAATDDQSTNMRWYAGTNTYTMALADGIGAGKSNTDIIIANQGYGDGSTYVARVCHEYKGGNYGDWYLPSKYELNLMYLNIGQGNSLGLGNIGGFINYYYWSSTEYGNNSAWRQYFYNGDQDYIDKLYADSVRAVRAF